MTVPLKSSRVFNSCNKLLKWVMIHDIWQQFEEGMLLQKNPYSPKYRKYYMDKLRNILQPLRRILNGRVLRKTRHDFSYPPAVHYPRMGEVETLTTRSISSERKLSVLWHLRVSVYGALLYALPYILECVWVHVWTHSNMSWYINKKKSDGYLCS